MALVARTNPDTTIYTELDWVIDSAASLHMSPHKGLFLNLRELNNSNLVTVGNGNIAEAAGIGSIELNPKVTLHEVLYVPGLASNLYVSMATSCGARFKFQPDTCTVMKEGRTLLQAILSDTGLYIRLSPQCHCRPTSWKPHRCGTAAPMVCISFDGVVPQSHYKLTLQSLMWEPHSCGTAASATKAMTTWPNCQQWSTTLTLVLQSSRLPAIKSANPASWPSNTATCFQPPPARKLLLYSTLYTWTSMAQ